jgi:hypothetical protein
MLLVRRGTEIITQKRKSGQASCWIKIKDLPLLKQNDPSDRQRICIKTKKKWLISLKTLKIEKGLIITIKYHIFCKLLCYEKQLLIPNKKENNRYTRLWEQYSMYMHDIRFIFATNQIINSQSRNYQHLEIASVCFIEITWFWK